MCSKKIKVNMLAAVLILTSMPPRVKLARGAVEYLAHLISQKLEGPSDVGETFSIQRATDLICR